MRATPPRGGVLGLAYSIVTGNIGVLQFQRGLFGASALGVHSIAASSVIYSAKEMCFQSIERRVLWSYSRPRCYKGPRFEVACY
jgi:hypothetical protein